MCIRGSSSGAALFSRPLLLNISWARLMAPRPLTPPQALVIVLLVLDGFILQAGCSMKAGSSAKRISSIPPAAQAVTANRRTKTPSQGKKYATIRRDLERQRKVMLEEVVEDLANPNGQEAFPDVSDQASAEAEQNFSMRIREREQRLIKKIDEALDRIDQNTYGICERCEEEIPYPRLKARPVTTLCINCKTLEEQEEKIRR